MLVIYIVQPLLTRATRISVNTALVSFALVYAYVSIVLLHDCICVVLYRSYIGC